MTAVVAMVFVLVTPLHVAVTQTAMYLVTAAVISMKSVLSVSSMRHSHRR